MCTNVLLIKSHVNSGGAQKPRFSLGERSTSFLPIHDCVGFRSSAFSPASIYSSLQDCYFSQQKSIDAAQYSLQVNQCRLVGSCFSLHISQRKAAEILIVFPVGISPPLFFPCCTSASIQQMALCGNRMTASFCTCGPMRFWRISMYKYSFCSHYYGGPNDTFLKHKVLNVRDL